MTEEYFQLLDQPCSVLDMVEQFIPHAKWAWVPYMTMCVNFDFIQDDLYAMDPFLMAARKEIGGSLQLYKFPAKTFYNWHKDVVIQCSLNMLLKSYESHTMFSKGLINENNIHRLEMLTYVPKRWYAFNSKQLHAVSNFGNEDRILFTMIFPSTTYEELLVWYKKYQIGLLTNSPA